MANSGKKSAKGVAAWAAAQRIVIQAVLATTVFVVASYFHINIWIIVGFGALTGLVFGKVFCRWMCPIGVFMEIIMGLGGGDGKFRQMYQYHKIGCPIAWISGALNKFSLLKIKFDEDSCASCGACDKACYISSLEPKKFSLYKKGMDRPGDAFSCSRCLSCVVSCPKGSLSYTALKIPRLQAADKK